MTPDGVECLLGGSDGSVDILSGSLRDLGQDIASRGIYDAANREGTG